MRPSDREMASYSAKNERRETPNILGEKRKTRPQNIPRGNVSDLHPTYPPPSPICSQNNNTMMPSLLAGTVQVSSVPPSCQL